MGACRDRAFSAAVPLVTRMILPDRDKLCKKSWLIDRVLFKCNALSQKYIF